MGSEAKVQGLIPPATSIEANAFAGFFFYQCFGMMKKSNFDFLAHL